MAVSMLQSHATMMKIFNSSLLASAAQQGAGLVNAFEALTTTTIISPGELSLNDTVRRAKSYQVRVTNIGDQVSEYKMSHHGAALATGAKLDDDQLLSTPIYSADFAVSWVSNVVYPV